MSGKRVPFLAVCTLALGCAGPESSARPGVSVRDSAGVTIVENRAPLWEAGRGWTVAPEPALRIGVAEGAPGYELSDVSGAVRLEDGTTVVADAGSQEIRLFDAAGTLVRRVGGRGDGPGEFSGLSALGRDWRGGVWAWDFALRRITRLDAGGDVASVVTLAPEPPVLHAVGSLADGSLVLRQLWGARAVAESDRAGLRRDPVAWVRVPLEGGSADTLGMFSGREVSLSVEGGRGLMSSVPFGRDAVGAVGRDVVVVGDQVDFDVAVLAPDGRLVRRIRVVGRDLALRGEDLAALRTARLEGASEAERPEIERWLTSAPAPERRPAYGDVLVDVAGHVWIGAWTPGSRPPTTWSVFDGEGRWVAELTMPEGFRPTDVGPDWILGVQRDGLGVERVALFTLVRPA